MNLHTLPSRVLSCYIPASKGGGVAGPDEPRSVLLPARWAGGQLEATVYPSFVAAHDEARAEGIDVRLSDVLRTREQQAAARARWERGEGPFALPPGQSLHERGRAVDVDVDALGDDYQRWVSIMARHGWHQVKGGLLRGDEEAWHFERR